MPLIWEKKPHETNATPTLSPSAHKHTRQPHHVPQFFLFFSSFFLLDSLHKAFSCRRPRRLELIPTLRAPKPSLLFLFSPRLFSSISFHLFVFVSRIYSFYSFSRARHSFELSSMARRICAPASDWLHANARSVCIVRCCDSKAAAYLLVFSVLCSNTSGFAMCGYDTRPRYAFTFLHRAPQLKLGVVSRVCIAFFASHVFIYFSKCFRSILLFAIFFALARLRLFVVPNIFIVLFLDEIVKVSYVFFAAIRVFAFLLSKLYYKSKQTKRNKYRSTSLLWCSLGFALISALAMKSKRTNYYIVCVQVCDDHAKLAASEAKVVTCVAKEANEPDVHNSVRPPKNWKPHQQHSSHNFL